MALTDAQKQAQNATGIADERFDPGFWGGRTLGTRPVDHVIWNTWTGAQQKGWEDAVGYSRAQSTRAWQDRFKTGGDIGNKWKMQEMKLAHANPQNEAQMKAALNQAGLFDRQDHGRARFRDLMMQFRGQSLGGGMYFDPETGQMFNQSTSDMTLRGKGRPATAYELQQLQRPFQRKMTDSLGITRWGDWARAGKAGVKLNPETGLYDNTRPNRPTGQQQFNQLGFNVNPQGALTGGHAMNPYGTWDMSWMNPLVGQGL